MKKTLIFLMVSLQTLLVIYPNLSASSKLNVTIDPRIELLLVVQYLSGYKGHPELLTQLDFPYKQAVKKTFSDYKEHPAIKMFARMSSQGFSYHTPPTIMLHLSDPPDLDIVHPLSEYSIRKAGGKNRLEKFIALLRDFARHSDFMSFYDSQRQTYTAILKTVEKNFRDVDFVGDLEDYFGLKQRSYNIILVPLSNGNYGPRLKHEDETSDIYNIISPRSVKDGILQFGTREYFRHLAWHEFGHSFVNPQTEKHMDELKKYVSLYKPMQKKMKVRAYGDWESTINEHIIRAVTTRLQYIHRGKENGDHSLKQEKNWGFAYVEHLCKKLEIYEKNRNEFPTFTAFYPQLVETFRELSEMDLGPEFYLIPYIGTINGVWVNEDDVLLVVPTNENDKTVQEKIHEYVRIVHNKLFKNNPLITDNEALNWDLSKHAVLMWGTPHGNLLLAKFVEDLPVKIETNRIVLDKVYEGENLRFITAWPNPFNPKKGLVIFTAQKAENIPGINGVFHGPTDYVLAKDLKVLNSGDFEKGKDGWTLKR